MIITGMLIASAAVICMTVPGALAQTTNQASIIGQVTVNGVATNNVSVTCGPKTATTGTYNGTDGVYTISGLPTNTSLPFSASYKGYSYTDTVEPLVNGQYFEIPTVDITMPVNTPTPVPNVTATPTPMANATATPTPVPNVTATPTPMANATATPTQNASATQNVTAIPSVNPTSVASPTPASTSAPTAIAAQSPTVAPAPAVVQESPVPVPVPVSAQDPTNQPPAVDVNKMIRDENVSNPAYETATAQQTTTPTPTPTPAASPGFEALMSLLCLTGIVSLWRNRA